MPTCIICKKEFKPRNTLQVTCGNPDCSYERNLTMARERKARLRAARPTISTPARKFSLESCPFSTGALRFDGRQPDFELGY